MKLYSSPLAGPGTGKRSVVVAVFSIIWALIILFLVIVLEWLSNKGGIVQ